MFFYEKMSGNEKEILEALFITGFLQDAGIPVFSILPADYNKG